MDCAYNIEETVRRMVACSECLKLTVRAVECGIVRGITSGFWPLLPDGEQKRRKACLNRLYFLLADNEKVARVEIQGHDRIMFWWLHAGIIEHVERDLVTGDIQTRTDDRAEEVAA